MKIFNVNIIIKLLIFLTIIFASCRGDYFPKPYGYFRVELPDHQYQRVDTVLPYSFELSSMANIKFKKKTNEKFWIDIVYPQLNATIYCSYKPVKNNIYILSEDVHRSVYKHIVKADNILENVYNNPKEKVFGVLYDLQGNVASVAQFVLTDSVNHFFMGAVYFNHVPNKDSIAPMAEYIKEDIVRLMDTFKWK
ncbi:hypothetical protein MASR2M117_09790 [Paludibacter sp.]